MRAAGAHAAAPALPHLHTPRPVCDVTSRAAPRPTALAAAPRGPPSPAWSLAPAGALAVRVESAGSGPGPLPHPGLVSGTAGLLTLGPGEHPVAAGARP